MSLDAALVERTLELSASERAELIRKLILTLEPPDFDADADELWAKEIKARIARVGTGGYASIEWRESVKRIRQTLRRGGRK